MHSLVSYYEKMKIIICVESFDPNSGYLESYLAKELSKLGHKLYIFTFGGDRKVFRKILREGFEVIRVPSVRKISNVYHLPSFNGVFYIIKFLKNERPDIVHCQPLGSLLSLIFLLFKSTFGYKIVGSVATQLNVIFTPWGFKKKILFCLSKILITRHITKKTEFFFAKTRGLAKILSSLYNIPQDKFYIIPLGADSELFKFDYNSRVSIRKKLGFSEKDVIIVYSGKINFSKRLHILLEALSPIIKKDRRVKLLIIGKGDTQYIEFLKNIIRRNNLVDNVVFHPWVERTLLSSFYSASDIGVWPGLSSTSIVDAASSGLPLIIARYPVETYAVENGNGFTFEIDNVKELEKYLRILIYDDKRRRQMGRKSRELVEKKLNWKSIALQYIHAYNLALGIAGVKCARISVE